MAACDAALAEVEEHLAVLQALTRRDRRLFGQTVSIGAKVERHAAATREILAARPVGGLEGVRRQLADRDTGVMVREARRDLDRLKADTMNLLAARDTAAYLQA